MKMVMMQPTHTSYSYSIYKHGISEGHKYSNDPVQALIGPSHVMLLGYRVPSTGIGTMCGMA